MDEMSDGIVSIPCEDAGDGKVVVNLADYRNAFRKAVCDGFGVEPGMVGLNSDYSYPCSPLQPLSLYDPAWSEPKGKRGPGFWKLWFKGKRVVFAEWLYVHVSGQDFPKDW